MKRNIAFWFVVVVLSLTLAVPAQQPTSLIISFTGTIPGQPDGDVDLRFRLFPISTGGTFVFEETQTVTVTTETFVAFIGNGTKGGLPPEIFASNPSLWIAFALDATPDTEIGDRTPITGSGYAFKAVNADNASSLGGIPASGFVQTTGGSMSGGSPGSTLTVTNTDSSSGVGITATSSSLNGAGGLFMNAVGDLIQGKRSASDRDPVFRLFNNGSAYFAGNVGIGTTISVYGLDIFNAGNGTQLALRSTDHNSGIELVNGGSGGRRWGIYSTNSAADVPSSLRIQDLTAGADRMVINSSGNVGIGTTRPAAKLTIQGTNTLDALHVLNLAGNASVVLWPQGGGQGGIQVNDGSGRALVRIVGSGDSYFNGAGNVGIGTTNPQAKLDVDGTTRTKVVEITGGSDLSEQFEVNAMQNPVQASVEPGMVVAIDPDNPGKLVVSRTAYDRKVAGIISGAGGIKPGMLMSQTGSLADGSYPVALTGRVYCRADASNGPIEPGDLLTTSNIPGHAMKVTDYAQAQGAILGKAMTGLNEGAGLVLVLVTLQ